jgi:hypothetical protein
LATELFEIWLYNHSQMFCQQAHCTRPLCRLHPHDLHGSCCVARHYRKTRKM